MLAREMLELKVRIVIAKGRDISRGPEFTNDSAPGKTRLAVEGGSNRSGKVESIVADRQKQPRFRLFDPWATFDISVWEHRGVDTLVFLQSAHDSAAREEGVRKMSQYPKLEQ
ncbi:MAG: hypothetical protein AB7O44_32900 [Hyphomicrobiaceae bacterium]